MPRSLVANLYARGGRPVRAAGLLLEEARDAVAVGALSTAHEILGRAAVLAVGDASLLVAITVERIQAFALATRTDDAIAAADAALPAAAGRTGRRWPSPLRGPAWPVSASTGPVATSHSRAIPTTRGSARSPPISRSTPVTSSGRWPRHRAAAAAEQARPPDVVCEALEVVGRALRRRDPAASTAAFERAERVADQHRLTPWRIRALAELGAAELFGSAPTGRIAEARALALDAGMLGTATALDLQAIAMTVGTEGMVGVMPSPGGARDRAGRLGLTGIRAHALMWIARGRVHRPDERGRPAPR